MGLFFGDQVGDNVFAALIGMAEQSLRAGWTMVVLIPKTLPSVSAKGPPDLPGLKAASVWMMFSMRRPGLAMKALPRALITRAVTVHWKPKGSR